MGGDGCPMNEQLPCQVVVACAAHEGPQVQVRGELPDRAVPSIGWTMVSSPACPWTRRMEASRAVPRRAGSAPVSSLPSGRGRGSPPWSG